MEELFIPITVIAMLLAITTAMFYGFDREIESKECSKESR